MQLWAWLSVQSFQASVSNNKMCFHVAAPPTCTLKPTGPSRSEKTFSASFILSQWKPYLQTLCLGYLAKYFLNWISKTERKALSPPWYIIPKNSLNFFIPSNTFSSCKLNIGYRAIASTIGIDRKRDFKNCKSVQGEYYLAKFLDLTSTINS